MTKKDYIKFAQIIREAKKLHEMNVLVQSNHVINWFAQKFVVLFTQNNERFNAKKFLEAIETGKGLPND